MRTSVKLLLCTTLLLLVASACSQRGDPTLTLEEEFGSMQIETLTGGANLDPDGYTLMIDEDRTQPIAINGSVILSNLVVGRYSAQLTDVAANCVVDTNPRLITVIANITVEAVFSITCS